MPKVTQADDFFVVGGPVHPERPCYVERAADRQLLEAIRAQRFVCVLGPHATGKTSLMYRTTRALRGSGELAANVDLVRLEARGAAASADGWTFAIAQRIASEIGVRMELEAWWRDRAALPGEQRLADFLWEIVLTNTTVPVTVFVDNVEAAIDLPFVNELFAPIHACYARRARERDFARLNFVLLGCTSRRRLAGGDRGSPFVTAELIEPRDFSPDEVYGLAPGLGGDHALAQALLDRVYVWTAGQPYLTQKVVRGVARKGGKLEDVERVVREQLLAPAAAASEPLLAQQRAWLEPRSPRTRRAAKVIRKLATSPSVDAPTDPAVLEHLLLSGVVAFDAENRRCRLRSRVYKELLAGPWRPRTAFGWKLAAAAAVLAAIGAAGTYWYLERLPVADVETLTDPTSAQTAIDDSYRRLRALPGFAERADSLWLEALERRSAAAMTLAEALAVDERVRTLPGQEDTAERWLAAFWLRRAIAAANEQERDPALLLAHRAAASPGASSAARGWLAELIGADYPLLERTLRRRGDVATWHMRFEQQTLATLDGTRQIVQIPFDGSAATVQPVPLTALRHAALHRELTVDGDGTAGEFELELAVQHPAGGELLVTLTAPSGIEASVTVPRGNGATVETFVFPAAPGSALAPLADAGRRGAWRLAIVDRSAGNAGTLASWGLRFGDDEWHDAPSEPLTIEDPARTDDVDVTIFGEFALVRPASPGAIGSIAVWSLATGRLENDFAIPAVPRDVAIDASGQRLLTVTDRAVTLWNVTDGAELARLATEESFVLPAVFSSDGGYFAIAERVGDSRPLYSVLRARDASLVGSLEGIEGAERWQLGPGARYAVLQGPTGLVRVLELRATAAPRTLPHDRAVERLLVPAEGAALVSVTNDGTVLAWNVATPGAVPRRLGTTTSAASVSLSRDGARVAFGASGGAVAVVDVASGIELHRLGRGGATRVDATQWASDRTALVSATASGWRLWRMPSGPAVAQRDADVATPTALALDRRADAVAIGLASGQLELQRNGASAAARLNFFGHRGAISAVAIAAERGLAASGGNDGVVRLWDLGTVAPTGAVMQPAAVPIAALALSADGRFVASGAGRSVRIARVEDGAVTVAVTLGGEVTALAFAADASLLAAGDALGAVMLTPPTATAGASTVNVGARVTALAFSPRGDRLAVGTTRGLQLLAASGGTALSELRALPQRVEWLDFNADGSALLVATEAWWLSLANEPELETIASRFVPHGAAPQAWAPGDALLVRRAAIGPTGDVRVVGLDLAEPPVAARAPLDRDWTAALALRLDDAGDVVPSEP